MQNTGCIRKPQVISGGGVRTPCTLPLDPPPLLQKLQFLPLSEAAGITHSCVDSAGEGRGALYSHVFFAKWVNTSCTTHRFFFICYIKNPTTDLHRECWFGFTQLWTSAFKQFILSYPILCFYTVNSQQHHPRSPTSYRNVRNIRHESFEWPFSP